MNRKLTENMFKCLKKYEKTPDTTRNEENIILKCETLFFIHQVRKNEKV